MGSSFCKRIFLRTEEIQRPGKKNGNGNRQRQRQRQDEADLEGEQICWQEQQKQDQESNWRFITRMKRNSMYLKY